MPTFKNYDGLLEECVALLKKHSIKLVAFDMDLTAVAIHSRGQLKREDLDEFLASATAGFKALAPKLHHAGFYLAIATHSDEAEFSGEVKPETHILGTELATALVGRCFSPQIASSFYIVAYNPRVHPEDDIAENKVKRYHMRKLVEYFHVAPHEILFFDDTTEVVNDCKETCGVRAFTVDNTFGFRLEDLLENLS